MDELLYAYAAEITKADERPDGTLVVYGKATGPDLDLDGQRCDPAWLKQAMPEWFKWGNIREQHGPTAAGTALELTEEGQDWNVRAHIVDPGTVAKVKAKVLKGFSIGVKNGKILKTAQVPKGIICEGDVVEVSLVDRPANPTCAINIAKSAGGVGDPLEPLAGQLLLDDDELVTEEDADKAVTADEAEGTVQDVGELRKGFIMDLLTGKNDQKRDHGKFAAGPHKDTEAEKRRAARLKAAGERKAHNEREDRLNAEALGDAQRARAGGRAEEAGEHLAVAAAHARTPGQYRHARREQRHTENLMREKGVDAEIVKAWSAEVDELLGAAPTLTLDAVEYEAAFELLRDDTMITKRHDEQADIDGAKAAISQIADLIISEATELKNDCPEEIDDIAILVEACRSLMRFCTREGHQQRMGDNGESYTYAVQADLFKRDFSADERADAADEGLAMPDGSFPIKTPKDLDNAIGLAGNAKNPDAARAHIKRRAKALGLSAQIPDTWKSAGADATLVDAGEIHKAVTEATGPLEAEIATLRETVARVEKMPIPGGPFVMTVAPSLTVTAKPAHESPDYWRSQARHIADPGVQKAYLAKAAELEGASS